MFGTGNGDSTMRVASGVARSKKGGVRGAHTKEGAAPALPPTNLKPEIHYLTRAWA